MSINYKRLYVRAAAKINDHKEEAESKKQVLKSSTWAQNTGGAENIRLMLR